MSELNYYEEGLALRIEELEAQLRKSALQELSALGQASDAYQSQLAAEAKLAKAMEALTKIECAYYMEASNPSPKTIRTMAARMNGIARDAQNTISDTKEEGQ